MSPYVNLKDEQCCTHGCEKKADVVIIHKKNGFYQPFCFTHLYWWANSWHKPKAGRESMRNSPLQSLSASSSPCFETESPPSGHLAPSSEGADAQTKLKEEKHEI